ncbi:GNAT family N-acetyltransferase [Streptomyces pinistramenti]|uniref:GNAT family N-acetyltransferase n=1 Tax=Streptomyces pinistramenti TaxID=2884812 RepID=UPI001D067D71|nr:GNAT family N-acetyltransferase [Streptomyces pinistramenti]MCB5908564.1 GNAT family N-acetyltransferase [Streptomyces pinistramenti]
MTTTLRPAGPDDRSADGHRARTYDVCVNSRRVGGIRLTTDPLFGPAAGRIAALEIDAPDRHRGRATVAALAAEEVLRGWGCRQIELTVPADARAALSLAAALGYTERSRRLAKPVTAAPQLPPGSTDRPLSEAAYPVWREAAVAARTRHLVQQGMPPEHAARTSAEGHHAMLPQGPATPGHALRILTHEGSDAGHVWVALRMPGHPGGYVVDVQVGEAHRGRGHGRTLLGIAERECRAAGRPGLGLTLHPGNAPAAGLHAALGYRPTAHLLHKAIL